jgi:N-acetylglucosamine-6-phosphate deacetylase
VRALAPELRLRCERIITPAGTLSGEVAVREGRIVSVGPGLAGGELVELGRRWLAPGLIDTHVHGGGGAQFSSGDPDEIAAAARFHATGGTTALLATTVSASPRRLAPMLEAIARVAAAGPGGPPRALLLGSHLEGPFVNRRRAGALDPATFFDPDAGVLEALLAAGAGTVRMVTLAPELPGALELIGALARAGVIASIGHSDATYEQVRLAALAGARAVAHTFNAMRGLHHREPGTVGAALDLPALSCELIADGVHVSAPALRLAVAAKGLGGLRLVTDAMQAAGMPDGDYRLGRVRVAVEEGRALVAGTDVLAGSTLTMDGALAGIARLAGLSVPEAVTLASTMPARLLGLGARKGQISPGFDADLTVLDESLRACGTLVGGRWAFGPP